MSQEQTISQATPISTEAPVPQQNDSIPTETPIESTTSETTQVGEESEPKEQEEQNENNAESHEDVVPANATHGGRETSNNVLYVGNLDKSITEDVLKQYFQVAGQVVDVKVMVDKKSNYVNYAFVEYLKSHDASVALQTLNGIQIENNKIKINKAFQSQQSTSDENTFNLFIGDLNIDIDDESLSASFKDFPSYIQAHVMWDMQTGRSRGYGFVSFADQEQAQLAMDAMQGKELNGRPIRINWATKREPQQQQQNTNMNRRGGFRNNNNNNRRGNNNNNNMMPPQQQQQLQNGMPPMSGPMDAIPPQQHQNQQQPPQQQGPMVPPPVNPQAIDDMIRRAPPRVTTAYIGNIPHFATEADLIPLLQNFGFILDFTHYPEKGCCFIKYDTHEQAAVCIVALANFNFQGRNLRTGWGKERSNFVPQQGQQGGPMPVMMGGEGQPQQGPIPGEQIPQDGQLLPPPPQQQQ
ncbi:nuclear and cytoplasmic polyadenylated RNA-binding protein Pub1p [Monosporozyma unispora]|nr:E3 ubiquitin-protein ligase pub1 [Kazachstania unispora]